MRKILVGLGNPGAKYENTYHNAGALALEGIMARMLPEGDISPEKSFPLFGFHKAEIQNGDIFIFVKPKTFMNDSGLAVKAVLKYFSAKPSEVIILHDDSDLNLGTIKISESTNLAGHHGLISIGNETGISNFKRMRIGIRNPDEKIRKKAEEFVLKNIPKKKMELLLGEALSAGWLELRKNS
ncbi:MAG: peptidyl-tRNA hydrolase, PTH1 family [Parcubacteria group bacterium LiPW_15]|jgi:PTH1 family peptidyl-tRNA hydrolase|nr:MAG: peptidyl-tRNA hydrolase, PTH1 family [Parcubacteria group bacterium LiPW_15]